MSQTQDSLNSFYNSCLDILRTEGNTGDRALRNLSYFLILKLIEPKLDTEIKIREYDYNKLRRTKLSEEQLVKRLDRVYFSQIVTLNDADLHPMIKAVNNDILSLHPATYKLYKKDQSPDIVNQTTYRKLLNKISEIDLSQTEYDVLGNSYENMIKNVMTGKVLGQFFTQPIVKNIMIDLVDPQLHEDGTMETIGDPTMGTGGFLISGLRRILTQSRERGITPDWDFITTQGLYGKEISPDTFQLALSNMLISSGHLFDNLEHGDSIRQPIDKKFDIVLANPPFGIKGLKYDEFTSTIRDQYIPIKTDNAVSHFLQAIIYMLKVGGRCAVVLPNGKDLFSKDKGFVEVRKYLMKTCDLREIIHLPSDVFENTSVKTCIFYFVKKCENAVKINVIATKTGKEKGREYEFVSGHQTTSVKFYNYNTSDKSKTLLIEVPIDKLEANSYSLNYAEYLDKVADTVSEGVVWMTLGEVCDIDYGTRIVKARNEEGIYPVYGSGRATFTTDSFNRENYNILIGRFALSAECVRIVNEQLFLNDSGLTVKPTNENLLHKFIGYYLLSNQNMIYDCARGTAQKNLDMDSFNQIKIPIPSLEKQTQIVEYLDYIYEVANKTSRDKIAQLKRLNEICLKSVGECEMKLLGDVCKVEYGTRITQKKDEGIEYPAYGGGDIMSYRVNNYNRDGITYKIARDGLSKHNCILKIYGKIFLNDTALNLKSLDETYLSEHFLGEYILCLKNTIYDNCTHGTAQLHIDLEKLMKLQIPIPSLEKQKEIVAYCDANDLLIQSLNNEIARNETQAKNILTSVTKSETKHEAIVEPVKAEEPIVEVPKKIKLKIIVKNKVA